MNKIVVVFNIDTVSFEFKLGFFFRSCRYVLKTLSCRKIDVKFAILILWVPASAISIPKNTAITDVNMAAVTNNTSQIKIPPCTFSQIVHNTKNTSNPKNMA